MAIKIDKGIPIPPVARKHANGWPFAAMNVGDSFIVPIDKRVSARTAVSSWHQRNKEQRLTGRSTRDGFRVWRIA